MSADLKERIALAYKLAEISRYSYLEHGAVDLIQRAFTDALDEMRQKEREAAISEHRLMQAQIWASEAKTQRSIVREIYQITTFSSGEPGDWNGAKPVKELMSRFVTACHEIARLRDRLGEMYLLHGDPHAPKIMGIRGITGIESEIASNDEGDE